MATYFAVHNDCIFKNPSLFYCRKACLCNPSLRDCNRAVFSTSFSIQCGSQHDAQALLMLSALDVEFCGCGIPDGSASLKRMYGKFFAKGILNKGQLALYDFFMWILIACRWCEVSDFLEQ